MTIANSEPAGVVVPMITPLDDHDRVDEPALRKLIRRLIQSGAHVLFVGGSAGEGPLLTTVEWTRLMEIAYDETNGALPLFGGVMDTSSARIAEKLRILHQIGYRYYVVTPVYYFPLKTADEHLRLFADCKEHDGGMEMIPYNLPGIARAEIPHEVLFEAARQGWVRHVKESSGNLDYFRRLVSEGRLLGLRAFMGDELGIVEGLKAGACGIVPVCANVEPQPFVAAYQAALAGDEAGLRQAYERILVIRQHLPLVGDYWVAGIKAALACLGIGSGKPAAPMAPLTAEQWKQVEAFVNSTPEAKAVRLPNRHAL